AEDRGHDEAAGKADQEIFQPQHGEAPEPWRLRIRRGGPSLGEPGSRRPGQVGEMAHPGRDWHGAYPLLEAMCAAAFGDADADRRDVAAQRDVGIRAADAQIRHAAPACHVERPDRSLDERMGLVDLPRRAVADGLDRYLHPAALAARSLVAM